MVSLHLFFLLFLLCMEDFRFRFGVETMVWYGMRWDEMRPQVAGRWCLSLVILLAM